MYENIKQYGFQSIGSLGIFIKFLRVVLIVFVVVLVFFPVIIVK